jgi:hypothetical protein
MAALERLPGGWVALDSPTGIPLTGAASRCRRTPAVGARGATLRDRAFRPGDRAGARYVRLEPDEAEDMSKRLRIQ